MGGESVADRELRNGYDRWLRLEEEKAAISGDLKELMAELKAQGFVPKALRESFRRVRNIDDADQREHDDTVDLYVASLTRGTRAYTRGSDFSNNEPATHAADRDAGGGEDAPVSCVDTNSPVTVEGSSSTGGADVGGDGGAQSRPLGIRLSTSLAGVEGDEDRQPVSTLQEGSEPIEAHNLDRVGSTPAPATNIVRIPSKPLRPYCQHMDDLTKCGGYGKTHCGPCLQARERQIDVVPGGVEIAHHGDVA